jgi:ABC-type uncharacterized transport system substrate-binding protein
MAHVGLKEINTVQEWTIMEELLHKHGYTVFQSGTEGLPDFYFTKFILAGRPDVVITTHDRQVEAAMKGYSDGHSKPIDKSGPPA